MTILRCPECHEETVEVRSYDYGVDSATGYHDEGQEGICLNCAHRDELSEFENEEYPEDEERDSESDRQLTGMLEDGE